MPPTGSFGAALKQALKAKGWTQIQLARALNVDPGQVSRWVTDKAQPMVRTVTKMGDLLGVDLTAVHAAVAPQWELFVSAPILSIGPDRIRDHRAGVLRVLAAAEPHVNSIFWPGQNISSPDDLAAPDLATERNLAAFQQCHAYLYLQFEDIRRPSSALIELGVALGRRIKTTIIIKRDLSIPTMLDGFQGVAAKLNFLPSARIYRVDDAEQAAQLVARNGRSLLGLD
jgi:transcriptional regulator with XRE-family HTH domain